jgi:protein-tyrosine phosphatase
MELFAMIRSILLVSLLFSTAPALAYAPYPDVVQSDSAHGHKAPAAAERFVLVEGGRNFRDIGGYRTADGRVVKSGIMYRSGSLGGLTSAGQATLAGLNITSVIDLRTTDERSRDSFDVRSAIGSGYWTRDYGISRGDMAAFFSDQSTLTAEGMRAMMAGAYKTMPREQAPSYRALFARLQAADGPLLLNCTAGKDRTGIGTALVLTALGVPYETVRRDFLLSNGAPGMETLQSNLSGPLARLPADVAAPIIGVDGSYLDTAFAQLRQDYGSVENYMERELGVGPREIAALKARMLES